MMSLTKIPQPQQNFFFRIRSRRLAKYFEGLDSSLAQSAKELRHWQGNQKLLVLGRFPGIMIYL